MRTPIEKGQKVLMLGDGFWMVLHSSQRPIRITPAQKLLGDASTGDVATMTWAEDYDGAIVGEADVDGVKCIRLDLAVQRRGVTYTRIELYLAKSDARPGQADLHVASEKLAKRATFDIETAERRRQVSAMRILDRIQAGRETVTPEGSRSNQSSPFAPAAAVAGFGGERGPGGGRPAAAPRRAHRGAVGAIHGP